MGSDAHANFDDGVFVRIMRRYLRALAPGGELVVGNFCRTNPSRPQMVLQDWILHHRTAATLESLAAAAGGAAGSVSVGREPEAVNLFLHVKKAQEGEGAGE